MVLKLDPQPIYIYGFIPEQACYYFIPHPIWIRSLGRFYMPNIKEGTV